MIDVYLHIGAPKTGTTSIQRSLENAAEPLLEEGILFAGGTRAVQRRAVFDVVGRRIPGADTTKLVGSWRRLVEEIHAWSGQSAVVSDELLVLCRPKQIARIVRDLAGQRVHVVLGLRDIGSLVPSTWQQEVRKGRAFTWDEYISAVRDPATGPATAGVPFWLRQDPLRILDAWERHVSRDEIRLVTLPRKGSPPTVLLGRFADAVGITAGVLEPVKSSNPSLGSVETEVIRRLNQGLGAKASTRGHLDLVRAIIPGLTAHPGRPLRLPQDDLPWAVAYTDALSSELRSRGYAVFGTLDDLAPTAAASGERRIDDVTDVELLDATEVALLGLSRRYTRVRRAGFAEADEMSDVGVRERVASSTRAGGFKLRLAALEHANDNRLLRWLAQRKVGKHDSR